MTTKIRLAALLSSFVALTFAVQCTAVQTIPKRDGRAVGFLRLEVEPSSTAVEIDETYKGRIDGWVARTVPVEAGARRVTLVADGYITRRFDIEIAAGEEVTLRLDMEPVLEDEAPREETPDPRRHPRR